MATPDPLAQLADIQEPTILAFWFERPLWWILLALAFLALLGLVRVWYKSYQKEAPRREALALLAALPMDANASAITIIVKRYLKSRSAQSPLLAATPHELQQFLAATSTLAWPDLMALHYQATPDVAALRLYRESVKRWLSEYSERTASS